MSDKAQEIEVSEDPVGHVHIDGSLEQTDFLQMSDEEMLKVRVDDTLDNSPKAEKEKEEEEPTELDAETETEDEEDAQSDDIEEDTEEPEEEEAPLSQPDDAEVKPDEDKGEQDTVAEDVDSDSDTSDAKEKEKDEKSEDLSKLRDEVFAPLKANGTEIEVKSVDELRKLASMGMNYTQKMQALSPIRKIGKMLEENGLLDEDKLSYLIDLDKHNPDAIAKLVKDSGIDTLSIDDTDTSGYKPNTYAVDDKTMALDTVVDSLSGTEHFQTTADVVKNKWDEASKQAIYNDPQILVDLNNQVASGVYDRVSKEVNRIKMLGGLLGTSDVEAYKQVGAQMYQAGELNDLMGTQRTTAPIPESTQVNSPKASKPAVDKAKVVQQKKAAAPTKGKPKKAAKKDFNPLALSDEEFAKIANLNYS